jgi:hypothetical protein
MGRRVMRRALIDLFGCAMFLAFLALLFISIAPAPSWP